MAAPPEVTPATRRRPRRLLNSRRRLRHIATTPEDLKPTPPPPPVQPLGRVVWPADPPPPVVEPAPVPEKSIYERAIAAAAASPRRKAPERGDNGRAVPKRAPSPALKHKVDPAAQRLYDRAAEVRRKLEEKGNNDLQSAFQPKIGPLCPKKVAETAASMAPRHEQAPRRRGTASSNALRARIETQQRREKQAHTPRMLTRGKPRRSGAAKSARTHAHAAAIRDRLAAQRARSVAA